MNRWWGNNQDSEKQAAERSQRQASRNIKKLDLPVVSSGDEDDFLDCDTSGLGIFPNLDGNDSDLDSSASNSAAVASTANMSVKFQDENAADDEDYYKKVSSLKNRLFNTAEPEFWFTSIESSLKHMGVKKQWSKREVLHSLLPDDVQIRVKHILKKDQDSAGTHPYKTLKLELLKIYAPKPEAAFNRALARTLTTSPSDLAAAIIDDLCTCAEPLQSECCQRVVWGMWSQKLPDSLRQRLSGKTWNQNTYKNILELADAFHDTNQSIAATPTMSVAAVSTSKPSNDANETLPAIPYAVNAVSSNRGNRGQRGNPRSNRGNRGGRGGNNRGNNRGNQNQNSTSRWPTTRHADLPDKIKTVCFNHHTYGRSAFHCTDPLTCEWASIPPFPRPKPVNN